MHKLRRRTCPGYDGRKNRSEDQDLSTSLDASTSDTWSNGDEVIQIQESATGKEGTPPGGLLFLPAAREVSRSPSPSSSPIDHARVGRGSVRGSATFVSEEERSPSDVKNTMGRRVSSLTASSESSEDAIMVDSQMELQRIVSEEVKMNEYFIPLQAEDDEANDPPVTKKSRKANQAFIIASDSENEYACLSHQDTRNKYTKEELLERQDHNQIVSEISRDLNEIAAGMSEGTSRGRGKGRSRLGNTLSQAVRTTSASPVFGFDKPYDYYYGAGKCDLLTYDGFDGFVVDEDNRGCMKEKSVVVSSQIAKEVKQASVVTTPPSLCPSVNQSLTEACLEGKLVSSTSTFDRTLAAAILSFCLPNHPEDPNLAMKIIDHLKTRPVLAQEFELYRKAMSPDYILDGRLIPQYHFICTSEDLRRDWKMFSTNIINRVCLTYSNVQLTLVENEAIDACNSCWFKEV